MGGNGEDVTTANDSPATTSRHKFKHYRGSAKQFRHLNHYRHARKKRRLTCSETEIVTLTPAAATSTTNHTSPSTSYGKFGSLRCKRTQQLKYHKKQETITELNNRKWVFSRHDVSDCKDTVTFVSYNILGVENASKHPDLYCKVRPKFLDWDCRKKLIQKELTSYNPSIICFQEVDRFDDLDKLLQKDGFRGVYQARTGEACDGCAIFWKGDRFTLVHQENIEFKKFGLRDNVAQLCILKIADDLSTMELKIQPSGVLPSRSLLVGNIHVLFNPNRGDIKLGQVRLFLENAHKLSQEWGNVPVLIGGDLNSMPQSAIYQFLASSELDVQLHDRRHISGQICPLKRTAVQSQNHYASRFYRPVSRPLLHRWSREELRLATGEEGITHLIHHLKLCSAYLGVPGSCITRDNYGEPLATSYHSKFMGTVDYIWHTKELVPVRVLETLPLDILRKEGLPCKKWGSDHLALVCELAFTNDGDVT